MAVSKKQKPVVVVAGSINTDMVVKTARFPQGGETIMGGEFFLFQGGKGANQAVAAARMGADVFFIGKTGADIFGKQSVSGFQKEGIHTVHISEAKEHSSGTALITVNAKGENTIVVAPGANHALSKKDLDKALPVVQKAGVVLMQLEIPLTSVLHLASKAKSLNRKAILNPAPAQKLPDKLYKQLYAITPNETEASLLTGVKVNSVSTAKKAAEILLKKGVQNVIITLGSKGAFFLNKETSFVVPAPKVKAVDTTAAGDVFSGVLAVMLAEGKEWKEILHWACKAASISVTRMGAQPSAPYRKEI